MGGPAGVAVIDSMLGFPSSDPAREYRFLRPLLRDRESLRLFGARRESGGGAAPRFPQRPDAVKHTLEEMDRHGIERALILLSPEDPAGPHALREHPDRFVGSAGADPNRGMEAVRHIQRMHDEYGIKAVAAFPAGCFPQVPIDDRRFFPVYAKCVELDLPICVCVGVPGPRVPMAAQRVERVDEVCWFFPELKFVMRHGAEPWTDLAVALMRRWPNLYYATSALAPRRYPKAIVDYANTEGADRILYAGTFPLGPSLERSFRELSEVPFRDPVWPRFLRENALRLFDLDR